MHVIYLLATLQSTNIQQMLYYVVAAIMMAIIIYWLTHPTQLRYTPNHHPKEQTLLPLTVCCVPPFRTWTPETLDLGFMAEAVLSFLMCLESLPPSTAHGPLAVRHVQLPRRVTAQGAPIWVSRMPWSPSSKPAHPIVFCFQWKFLQQFLNCALMGKNFILLT